MGSCQSWMGGRGEEDEDEDEKKSSSGCIRREKGRRWW